MPGNIFINYRRDDSSGVAGRLHDSLAPTFGRNKLFMDVDNITGRERLRGLPEQPSSCLRRHAGHHRAKLGEHEG